MAMVFISYQMGQFMRVSLKMGKNREKENIPLMMVRFIRVIFLMGIFMGKELWFYLMGDNIVGNGNKEHLMDMG
jgi:hypothetical protein